MSDINEIKRLIAESEGVELSNWNTVTHAQREAWASIETQGRGWIIEFLTTIESQKEEIEKLNNTVNFKTSVIASLENIRKLKDKHESDLLVEIIDKDIQIQSLKAIKELAVKGLEQFANRGSWTEVQHIESLKDYAVWTGDTNEPWIDAKSTLSEIERLQNEK